MRSLPMYVSYWSATHVLIKAVFFLGTKDWQTRSLSGLQRAVDSEFSGMPPADPRASETHIPLNYFISSVMVSRNFRRRHVTPSTSFAALLCPSYGQRCQGRPDSSRGWVRRYGTGSICVQITRAGGQFHDFLLYIGRDTISQTILHNLFDLPAASHVRI